MVLRMPLRKRIIPLLPLLIAAFSPAENGAQPVENYYNFQFLKSAEAPREARIIRYDMRSRRQVIQTGILVTYKNRNARRVGIAGDFSHWKILHMERSNAGVWYHLCTGFNTAGEHRYKLIVDGTWISDPANPSREDDGTGSYVSLLNPPLLPEGTHVTYRRLDRQTIEFRIFKPDARLVSLVGDFNNWNPENDLLRKGRDGIWRLHKKLTPGTYRYQYVIDGRWTTDLYNENTASDESGRLCSLLKIQ